MSVEIKGTSGAVEVTETRVFIDVKGLPRELLKSLYRELNDIHGQTIREVDIDKSNGSISIGVSRPSRGWEPKRIPSGVR